ncbi:MAG: antitoxin [Tetrasphaera sp.]|nr:antitoxin [Tetrasphaera sp.]
MNTKTPPSLKAKAQQRGLDPKVVDLADKADAALKSGLAAADQAIKVGIDKAGTAAVEHRDKVDEFLDKAVQTINEKTGGKYATQIDTVRSQVAKGVDKLAESAVAAKNAQDSAGTAAATAPTAEHVGEESVPATPMHVGEERPLA